MVVPEPSRILDGASCGNGRLESQEECDDGNDQPGDGCTVDCRTEPGYVCPSSGGACRQVVCGDGAIEGDEECEDDDISPTSDDGCSADCQIEEGFKCPIVGAPCEAEVCGDLEVEGAEQCDDGNTASGDGCMTWFENPWLLVP